MKTFIVRFLYFLIPFWIYLGLIYIVDPYNYINKSDIINNELKEKISFKLHYPLWKLIQYQENPKENILLGDSRTNLLKVDEIKRLSGMEFSGLAYGGGSINEIVETFWTISSNYKLKNVYIGINFNLYNKLNNKNRVAEAKSISSNFVSYAFSRYTFDSFFLIVKAIIFNEIPELERPNMSKEEFWDYQLDIGPKNYYSVYKYPDNYFQQLKEISEYCSQYKIKLVFIIHPSHIDLQSKVIEYGLSEQGKKFKDDLKSLAMVYDFDYPSEITSEKNDYLDPFHYDIRIARIIINEVFNEKPLFAK